VRSVQGGIINHASHTVVIHCACARRVKFSAPGAVYIHTVCEANYNYRLARAESHAEMRSRSTPLQLHLTTKECCSPQAEAHACPPNGRAQPLAEKRRQGERAAKGSVAGGARGGRCRGARPHHGGMRSKAARCGSRRKERSAGPAKGKEGRCGTRRRRRRATAQAEPVP
jgi:hypothetical protein